ncbi:alpha-1,2-fucosyltransferase [Mucilaginibacter xinganensis]|uniref:Alpha-1,2-fucosyltransferase n=1 Tax=Mucilaginibacter xinganensis TaxID=1234841 RepID=A0A223P4A8_9SPHI|nr:alpha-1,2-fucosyltransferase [Mucilaginibacter xinganensis]ASU36804.1 hypothetical protein MuYL_4921 [Mucilaginibacter xinganensis]
MILIKLQGGLGNQMFQYAFGLALSAKLNTHLYFDLSFFKQDDHGLTPRTYQLDLFSKRVNIAGDGMINRFLNPGLMQRICNKTGIGKTTIYREKAMSFNPDVFAVKQPAYVEGFWQSELYFAPVSASIRKALTFRAPLNEESAKIAAGLAQQANTVSVHVRRGDYVSSKTTNQLHGTCSVTYYQKAIALVKEQVADPVFFFFSDDSEWVQQHLLPLTEKGVLVQHNLHNDSWQDMALMSKCKHHIIANSSFSWWGAWLNPDIEKVVIAPEDWFNTKSEYFVASNIVPSNWLRLPNE